MNRYEALKHAVRAHAGQADKCGKPYILHPLAVAECFTAKPPDWHIFGEGPATYGHAEIVALLHDVWEDTDYALPIRETNRLVAPLAAITRMPGEPYADYLGRVCANETASVVKLADLWHNLQSERQDCLPEKERKGLEKRYLKARDRIWEALGYEWWPESSEGGSK